MRQIEFIADEEGDCPIHCHKSHHTMNAIGHEVPTMIGVDQRDLVKKITAIVPDYMAMGGSGMGDMTQMEMPIPDNTIPMMSGNGPFGSLEMGGMFSVLKVRKDQAPGDFQDAGWFAHPPGSVAQLYKGPTPKAVRTPQKIANPQSSSIDEKTVYIQKPQSHIGSH